MSSTSNDVDMFHLLAGVIAPYVMRMLSSAATKVFTYIFKPVVVGLFGVRQGTIGPLDVTLADHQMLESLLEAAPDGHGLVVRQQIRVHRLIMGKRCPWKYATGVTIYDGSILLPGVPVVASPIDSSGPFNGLERVVLPVPRVPRIAFYHPGPDTRTLHLGSWGRACKILRMHSAMVLVIAGARLVLWHLLQPAVYFLALSVYWDEIDFAQQILGSIVGIREAFYIMVCIVMVIYFPAALLYDPLQNLDESKDFSEMRGWKATMLLVLAPEKFCCFQRPNHDCVPDLIQKFMVFVLLASWVADCCAVASLIVGACKHTLHAPLAFGYGITMLSGAVSLLVVFVLRW